MERNERLKEAFDYLRSKGEVHTQADIADRMNASRPNISSAFKGDAKCLTDKFLIRFNKAFRDIFNEEWLLQGKGEMLRPAVVQIGDNNNQQGDNSVYNSTSALEKALDNLAEQIQLTKNAQRQTDKAQEQMDRLLAIIENMQK